MLELSARFNHPLEFVKDETARQKLCDSHRDNVDSLPKIYDDLLPSFFEQMHRFINFYLVASGPSAGVEKD